MLRTFLILLLLACGAPAWAQSPAEPSPRCLASSHIDKVVLKGMAVGLLPALLFGCPAECVLRSTAAYGLLGLAIDAIDTNRDTVYHSGSATKGAVGFHVRF